MSVVAFTQRPISLPGRVPTAHWTTGCVGPRTDLEALKIEQFFAVAGDQHTVCCLSNPHPQPLHRLCYSACWSSAFNAWNYFSDKGHAVTLPLSIVISHHIPHHLLKKTHGCMIPIPDMLFRSDMLPYEGNFFKNICMSIKFSEVPDTANNNVGAHTHILHIKFTVFYIFGSELCIHPKGKKWDYYVGSKYVAQSQDSF